MKRLLLPVIILLFFGSEGVAQQLPLYTQYIFNPYLINPSMVAIADRPELNLLYRQQWANISDGPKTLQFDFQLPVNSKMAFGINVNNDRTVLLSATSVLLTYGYKIQLAPSHQLGFGLSAGIFSNKLDLSQVPAADATDPILLTSQNNSMALDGQFGVHYKHENLVLGYSLVNLLERKSLSTNSLQDLKATQLQNQIFFASYRFAVKPATFYLQPNVAYRLSQDNFNYYEASLLGSYRNIIDVGGGYRQNFGPTVMLRVHVKRLQIGVSYDFPSNTAQVSGGGTREIQLKWRFGAPIEEPQAAAKKNSIQTQKEEDVQPVIAEKVKEEPKVIPQEPKVVPKETTVVPVETKVVPQETKPEVKPIVVEEKPKVVSQPETKPAVDDEYYYIIGAFENRENAVHFLETARKNGLKAEMKESKPGKVPFFYYIHLPEYKAKEISLERVMELRKITKSDEAWFSKLN